jgi:mannose-6-phosphate isomerase-like protein (cupin superfamily)
MTESAVARPGDRYLLAGAELITFILRGQEYSLLENATQAGYAGPPPHRHLRQDEGFYVLEGQFTFHIDGQTVKASAGQFPTSVRVVPTPFKIPEAEWAECWRL